MNRVLEWQMLCVTMKVGGDVAGVTAMLWRELSAGMGEVTLQRYS